jgi:hypothetical protein
MLKRRTQYPSDKDLVIETMVVEEALVAVAEEVPLDLDPVEEEMIDHNLNLEEI